MSRRGLYTCQNYTFNAREVSAETCAGRAARTASSHITWALYSCSMSGHDQCGRPCPKLLLQTTLLASCSGKEAAQYVTANQSLSNYRTIPARQAGMAGRQDY